MALPSFAGNFDLLIEKLKNDIAKYQGCEGTASFIDASKHISKGFYRYFSCYARGPSVRSLIDIQAEFELSDRNMKEFEEYSKNMLNVTFTLRALGIEVEKMRTCIELIYGEIREFWSVVKSIESQNIKIVKTLSTVWRIARTLKESLYVLSRHQKQFIEENSDPNLFYFSEYMDCTKNEELNSLLKSFSSKSMHFTETLRQMKFMNELLLNHQKLKAIHPMFSFELILLINDPRIVLTNDVKVTKTIVARCSNLCSRFPCVKKPATEKPLIKSPDLILNTIEGQAVRIGTVIHKTTNEIREIHCASLRREQIVFTDIQSRRMVMISGLNELQNVIAALDEMEDCNDTLVGIMTKSRPMFNHINEYLKLDISKTQSIMEKSNTSKTTSFNSG